MRREVPIEPRSHSRQTLTVMRSSQERAALVSRNVPQARQARVNASLRRILGVVVAHERCRHAQHRCGMQRDLPHVTRFVRHHTHPSSI